MTLPVAVPGVTVTTTLTAAPFFTLFGAVAFVVELTLVALATLTEPISALPPAFRAHGPLNVGTTPFSSCRLMLNVDGSVSE